MLSFLDIRYLCSQHRLSEDSLAMSETARPKYSSTAPSEFRSDLPENSRKDYRSASARPPGRSGGGPPVSTPHRVSASRRRSRKEGRA